jgi:hypothetical protein
LEEKYNSLHGIISQREGIEQTQEIIDSLKYMFDESRYDKVIPFVDYQQKIIGWYMNQFNIIKNYNNRLIFYFLVSAGINIYFLYKLI